MAIDEYSYPEYHCTVRVHRPELPADERKKMLEDLLRSVLERNRDVFDTRIAAPKDKEY